MAKVNKFGTFSGVFTPSILTILGVIMYLRLPMIVGEAGLWSTIGIIIIAHIISVTTGLSVSSIATDKKVEAGGTYFMISRSLGLPIGGTLGLALFVGLSFSVSLYLIGFAESFLSYWGFDVTINAIRLAGTVILVVVTTITFISTSLAIKTQYFIMVAIILSLISIFAGSHEFGPQTMAVANTISEPSRALPFMLLFGIFFPAVTGFEAGVSMSGDLKDPKRSIPAGSIMAIVVGLVVYILLAVFFALTVDRNKLATDSNVLLEISWIPELVIAGIWGATLSSALGSILGAPRILQATASDQISPRFFAKGVGASNEPRNALLLTFLIAEVGILIGQLDIIARIVSIFFITTYGFLNLSCAFERWTSADFRPSFKTPVWVSLLGAIACFIVMIELDFLATLGAIVILGGIYFFLKRKELVLQSGDAWGGVWSSLAKTSLQHLTSSKQHHRNWRPNILMFNGADAQRPFMLELGKAIAGKHGLLSSFELILSKEFQLKPKLRLQNESETVFNNVYPCHSIYSGIDEVARLYGYAGVEPNTILMGWSNKAENKDAFIQLMSQLQHYDLNALYLYHHATGKKLTSPSIDIWWSGWGKNLSLALNVLKHLSGANTWNRATIRLCLILNRDEDIDRVSRYIKNILLQYREHISLKIIDNHITQLSRHEIITTESAHADLAIIGIPDSSYDDLPTTYRFASAICDHLQSVLFINASSRLEEHTVTTEQTDINQSKKKNEWVLPSISESIYPELIDDIKKIDERGLVLIESLHKKVFVACIAPELTIYKKMNVLTGTVVSALNNVMHYEQPFQRHAAVMRAKKHFNNQVVELLEHTLVNLIPEQDELLGEGVKWYLNQLEEDVNHFPKFKFIQHSKEKFTTGPEDEQPLRWFKLGKRIMHPFAKKTITSKINYREGASYFFCDLRYQFLTVLLINLEKSLSESHEKFRQFISWTDESFQIIGNAESNSEQDRLIKDFAKQVKEKADALIAFSDELLLLNKGRLQVEYRKNLNFFSQQVERVDFNSLIRNKRRSKKYFETKKEIIVNFPSSWSQQVRLGLNTTKTDAILNDFLGLAYQEMRNYNLRLKQFFAKDQQQPVTKLIAALASIGAMPMQSKQPTIPEWKFDYRHASVMLNDSSEKLQTIVNSLPEVGTISAPSDPEGLLLPIKAMVSHLTGTTLIGPINDFLEELAEKIERSNLVINDYASLAMFNVFNLKEADEESLRLEEINQTNRYISQEMETLTKTFEDALKNIEHQCDELKNALKLHNLSDISSDFSTLVRNRKKKDLQTRLSTKTRQLADYIKGAFVSLLYSQAKGILFSKQLSATQSLSVNERVMNLVNSATPDRALLQKLPHYYVSLFSGRSNIGGNFWIDRPLEENQFDSAHDRYKVQRGGFILVLGERNTGKTLLCKHFSETHADSYISYHVFPPEEGSVTIETFSEAVGKATKFEGNAEQVLGLLPHNSMLIIHDLELWWERSEENGLTVIRHIKELVEQFSSKCLFIINMNPFAFATINVAESLDTHCAGVVRCMPFNSHQLKQLVMTRHKSSGLELNFNSATTDAFREIRLARTFNSLFLYASGNPGVAMNAWLTGITDFVDKTIDWKTPSLKNKDVLAELPEVWSHVCLQLLLHKRMNIGKILRSIHMEKELSLSAIETMRRLQLITVRGNDIYYLNPNIEFLLTANFREREWI